MKYLLDKYWKSLYNEREIKRGGVIMAVASLVLGICALAFPFIGLGPISIILGIIGIILGALGKKNVEKQGMATAGIVMSIIAVALGIIFWLACAACVSSVATIGSTL
ncbi:MAG: DUF4190 domain-containing protein [Clostridia bacterium]|nr:DUF4190 domain-containing protein [Clostridia bacterium]